MEGGGSVFDASSAMHDCQWLLRSSINSTERRPNEYPPRTIDNRASLLRRRGDGPVIMR